MHDQQKKASKRFHQIVECRATPGRHQQRIRAKLPPVVALDDGRHQPVTVPAQAFDAARNAELQVRLRGQRRAQLLAAGRVEPPQQR